jgi:hypothetical protein
MRKQDAYLIAGRIVHAAGDDHDALVTNIAETVLDGTYPVDYESRPVPTRCGSCQKPIFRIVPWNALCDDCAAGEKKEMPS